MKTQKINEVLFVILVVALLLFPSAGSKAATLADVTSVDLRGGTLLISGPIPCQQTVYTKVSVTKKPENAIKVFVYRKPTGLRGCSQFQPPYFVSVSIQKYFDPTRSQSIYVNGVKYYL